MTCDRSFLAKLRRLTVPVCGGSEGSSPLGANLAPHTCIRSVRLDPDHDAVMRIGGEAPGGGPILSVGISAMFEYGFPPPRIVNSAVGWKSARAPNGTDCYARSSKPFQAAGRKTTPSNVSPVVTKRQSAMTSLRASATIMVLRVPRRLSAVRARYHSASALCF